MGGGGRDGEGYRAEREIDLKVSEGSHQIPG